MARSVNFVKRFLKENRVLLSYIYDENGFKRGVALAINANQVGWSLVSAEDYEPYRGRWQNIPAVQRIVQEADTVGDITAAELTKRIFALPAFTKTDRALRRQSPLYIRTVSELVVMKPRFDKYTGIAIALRRALADTKNEPQDLPADANAIAAITNVAARAESFFA